MKLEQILKVLDGDTLENLNKMSQEELNTSVITSEQSIREAKNELDENPNYVHLKEDLKALRGGFNDLKKRQTAIINYSLLRLEELGKV